MAKAKTTAKKNIKGKKSSDLVTARRVLATEARALDALAKGLGNNFKNAVDVLQKISGRVVVTGMGKSGHIARKMAATFSSTGKPSFFVHPGEASHGDLGMIQKNDAVIALSNSGETAELSDIVAYTTRYRIPLVGITGKAGSTLSRQSDVALVLPDEPEACPMGLAPTTSTTAMLALGDALAVCLLEREGFTAADFHDFHPGGKLGQKLLKVSDLMHSGDMVPLINKNALMGDALIEITSKSFGVVGVTGPKGKLEGVVTDGDLRRHMNAKLLSAKVSAIMTKGGVRANPDQLASEAVAVMNENKITTLFVIAKDLPVGILHIHDCLRAGVI